MLEFEDEEEAERVLNMGTRRLKDKMLHLERWSEEVGCLPSKRSPGEGGGAPASLLEWRVI